jgi:hypothetical protein
MKRFLHNNRAEGYIDTVVCVMAAMMVIVLALNVFSFLALKQDMDFFAKELIDTATIHGRTSVEVTERYNELCNELGFRPTYSFSGTQYYNTSTKTVQLGDTIMVSLSYRTNIQGLGALSVPVTLVAGHSGLSQKYWK